MTRRQSVFGLRGIARRLRRDCTEEEALLWWWLRDAFPVRWRRQAPIGRYVVDFVSFEARIVIEVDGSQHAGSVTDRVRDAWLGSQGFTVLRFWNHEVWNEIEMAMDTIEATLDR